MTHCRAPARAHSQYSSQHVYPLFPPSLPPSLPPSPAAPDGGPDRTVWEGGEIVQAVAYDNPVPGFDTYNTINLRLFRAAPAREFDLASFNTGDYMRAVDQRQRAETITHVLYPSDNTYVGKELRLKQQYFFVCATLQDVVRRFKRMPGWVRREGEGGREGGVTNE